PWTVIVVTGRPSLTNSMLPFVVSVNCLVTAVTRGSPFGPRMLRYRGHDSPTVRPNGGQVTTSLVPVATTMMPVSERNPGADAITVSTPVAVPVAVTAPTLDVIMVTMVSANVTTAGVRCTTRTTSPWRSLPFTTTPKPHLCSSPSDTTESATR